tara:strand:+ start:81 stop:596 length:516 start_codon:yes stop_codon:yes gene_type:complete
MKVVDISDEIFRELGEPSTLSIPAIAYWIRSNVGQMNNLIHTDYYIQSKDLEIVTLVNKVAVEIGENEKAILKKMYFIHFYDQKLRTQMLTMDTDTVIAVRDGDSSVTKVNRNEIAKSIAAVKNQEYQELRMMVQSYSTSKAGPLQVAGDDTTTDGSEVSGKLPLRNSTFI